MGRGVGLNFILIEKLENFVVLRVEENVKVIPSSLSLSLTGGNPSFILISPVLCDQSDFLTRVVVEVTRASD